MRTRTLIAALPLAFSPLATFAQEPLPAEDRRTSEGRSGYQDVPQFGGASSTGGQLKEDDAVKEPAFRFDGLQRALEPYFDWKARLNEEHGLAFGVDYTALYYGASDALPGGRDSAGSGDLRVFGSWTAVGRKGANTGSLVFKGEHRHAYGSLPVSGLGFETGYVGLVGPPFNDRGWMLTNMYWQQRALDGRLTFNVGLVDATDYLDVYGMISPWLHFDNFVFTTGSATIPVPDQGLGLGMGAMVSDNVYVVAGLADANGDPTDPGGSFDSFFSEREYFTHVELGWTSSQQEIYVNNAHLTFWHADERSASGTPDGWGLNASAGHLLDGGWYPFVRAGIAEDGGSLLKRSLSVGCGYWMPDRSDLLGLGLNWGQPADSFGADLPDQYTAELSYRLQLSPNFALTPDVQLVVDPAQNPAEDAIVYLGLRARLAL